MKADIGVNPETKRPFVEIKPESRTEWTLLAHFAAALGLDLDEGAGRAYLTSKETTTP